MRKLPIFLVLIAVLAFGVAASGNQVTFDYNNSDGEVVENVDIAAFDCDNDECSEVSEFSGEFVEGTSTSDGSIRLDYPADLKDNGYAVYHVSEGYVPLEYRSDFACPEGAPDCISSSTKTFYKLEQCSATVDATTAQNTVYRNEPITVNVDASIDSSVDSAFEDADTGVEHVPEEFKDQYYKAQTAITLKIIDPSGNVEKTEQFNRNIFMSSSQTIDYEWEPAQEGEYEIILESEVTDNQCASQVASSSNSSVNVQPERPQEEYYTIINGFNLENSNPDAGDSLNFNFERISNFADENYSKTPVETDVNYTIVDASGNTVFNTSTTLEANSNSQDPETASFTWSDPSEGDFTATVTGEPVEEFGGYPSNSSSQQISFNVDEAPTFDVRFEVTDGAEKLENAAISLGGKLNSTNGQGIATIQDLNVGNYTYSISKSGYQTASSEIEITEDRPSTIEITETLSTENAAPQITGLEDEIKFVQGDFKVIDLDGIVEDQESLDSELSWTVSGNQNIQASISSDRKLNLSADNFVGTETIELTVEDPEGAEDNASTLVNVTETNSPPTIDPLPDQTLQEDSNLREAFYLGTYISDEETDFENLDISVSSLSSEKCGFSIRENDNVDIVPDNDFAGNCTVTLQATDEKGASTTGSFNITVLPVNDAPSISSSAPREVDAYSQYRYEMSANDPDNSSSELNYSVEEGPEGLVSNGEIFTWDNITNSDEGNYSVRLKVSDGIESSVEEFNLTVNSVPPSQITDPPTANISVNTTKGSIPLTVSFNGSESFDIDGNIVSYDWRFGEGGTAEGETTNYTYTDGGNYTATLTVTDNASATDTASVEIEVLNNDNPFFTSSPVTSATTGESYSYDAEASDNDNDRIEYLLRKAPSGMTINNETGLVEWNSPETGDYEVVLVATDGELNGTQSYTLAVTEPEEDNSGGGSSGGSSGGGGGGGYSIGGVTEEESISDRIQLSDESSELNLNDGSENYSIDFRVDEETNITTSVNGNISQVVSLPVSFTAKPGNNSIPLTINRSIPGNYTGTIVLNWNGEELEVPLSLEVAEERQEKGDFTVAILSNNRLTTSDRLGYSIKAWDEKTPDTSTEVELTTRVEDSDGNMVYENNRTLNIVDVVVRDFQTARLPQGSYTITTTITHNGEEYTGFKQIELDGSNSITGQFNASEGVTGIIERIMNFFRGLL